MICPKCKAQMTPKGTKPYSRSVVIDAYKCSGCNKVMGKFRRVY